MAERSENIFGNVMPKRVVKKAIRTRKKNMRKFGDDSHKTYPVHLRKNPVIGEAWV